MLFQVRSASVPPFLRTTQEADQFAQQLGVGIGDDLLAQFVTATQNQLGVRINQQNFRNATGGES
jgi:peptidyl-prolyl cis-trans isomerase D